MSNVIISRFQMTTLLLFCLTVLLLSHNCLQRVFWFSRDIKHLHKNGPDICTDTTLTVPLLFSLQRDPCRALCRWGRVTPSHRGVHQRDHYPLWTWLNGLQHGEKRPVWATGVQYTQIHTVWFTIPINHWHRLISYGFQFPPGHICIDQLQV